MWLIAVLVVVVIGAAGIRAIMFNGGRRRPRMDAESRPDARGP